MTPLVLVILAVMWILVLVPPLLRSRTDGRPSNSISSFQRQLRTLQRSGGYPQRGSVSYLRAPSADPGSLPATQGSGRGYPGNVEQRFDDWYGQGDQRRSIGSPASRNPVRPTPVRSARHAAAEREVMRRRRQNVLLTLVAGAFLSAVIGFGMGVSVMVWVFAATVAALVLYVIVLIQMQRAAELRSYRSSWSRIAA